jgi:hypothetical protein
MTKKHVLKLLGPGIDASDLHRGDLSPHETFSVRISPEDTSLS